MVPVDTSLIVRVHVIYLDVLFMNNE